MTDSPAKKKIRRRPVRAKCAYRYCSNPGDPTYCCRQCRSLEAVEQRKDAAKEAQAEFKELLTAKRTGTTPAPARHRQKPTIAPQGMDAVLDLPRLFEAPRMLYCPKCNDRKSNVKGYLAEQPHIEALPGLYVCEKCGRVRAGNGSEDEPIPALIIGESELDRVTFTPANVLCVQICETTAGVGPADYVRLIVSSRDVDRRDGSDQVHACKVSVVGDYWRVEIGAQIGKREQMELRATLKPSRTARINLYTT